MADQSNIIARLLAELADVRTERDAYERETQELRNALASANKNLSNEAPDKHSSSDILSPGAETATSAVKSRKSNLRHAEELAMKEKFDLFANSEGTISASDLSKLHIKLGDPLNEGEAEEAVRYIGNSGMMNFSGFISYWWGVHGALQRGFSEDGVSMEELSAERDKKRQRYFKRFQLKHSSRAARLDRVKTEEVGDSNTLEYRLRFFYEEAGERMEISPWHDIPLMNDDGTLNMVVEIPRWTRRKLEIATGEAYNPIRLDSKNGLVRILNYGDQLFNYGAFPQTWESPSLWTEDLDGSKTHGDNDPIDVVEIGARQFKSGSIIRVKVLGVLGLIDAGETDWKVFA